MLGLIYNEGRKVLFPPPKKYNFNLILESNEPNAHLTQEHLLAAGQLLKTSSLIFNFGLHTYDQKADIDSNAAAGDVGLTKVKTMVYLEEEKHLDVSPIFIASKVKTQGFYNELKILVDKNSTIDNIMSLTSLAVPGRDDGAVTTLSKFFFKNNKIHFKTIYTYADISKAINLIKSNEVDAVCVYTNNSKDDDPIIEKAGLKELYSSDYKIPNYVIYASKKLKQKDMENIKVNLIRMVQSPELQHSFKNVTRMRQIKEINLTDWETIKREFVEIKKFEIPTDKIIGI